MKFLQKEIQLRPVFRGFHLVTGEVLHQIPELKEFKAGIFHLFILHTSASLTVNENADPTVREDFEAYFNKFVPENEPYYKHTDEGPDDMPAHIKAAMIGNTISLPVKDGKLVLGTWQGIYLCEHRNRASGRRLFVTVFGEKG